MRLINRSPYPSNMAEQAIDLAELGSRDVLIYLDDRPNISRRHAALSRIKEYGERGWKPMDWDIKDSQADVDIHACFSTVPISGALPDYFKVASEEHETSIYLDSTSVGDDWYASTIFLAHECRHAWQYYENPGLYHTGIVLGFVEDSLSNPSEIDAEAHARKAAELLLGKTTVATYLRRMVETGPEEHKDTWTNLLRVEPVPFEYTLDQARQLLVRHAEQIGNISGEFGDIKHLQPSLSLLDTEQLREFNAAFRRGHLVGRARVEQQRH